MNKYSKSTAILFAFFMGCLIFMVNAAILIMYREFGHELILVSVPIINSIWIGICLYYLVMEIR